MQPPAVPRLQDYYRGHVNIADAYTIDRYLVLHPLPPRYTFMVMSSLMQMLTARGLFSRLPSEDPHAHIAKLRSMFKSCVGGLDLDRNVIGLRLFPLSLIGDAATWFTELPYNSIHTWD